MTSNLKRRKSVASRQTTVEVQAVAFLDDVKPGLGAVEAGGLKRYVAREREDARVASRRIQVVRRAPITCRWAPPYSRLLTTRATLSGTRF